MHRLFRPFRSVRQSSTFQSHPFVPLTSSLPIPSSHLSLRPALVLLAFALAGSLSSCHSSSGGTASSGTDSAGNKSAPANYKPNPEDRATVKKEPVAEYRVRTDDKLNESWFSVRLYETSKTMRYRVTLEFEGLTGEDTVKLPDLGTAPQPVIEKDSGKYSCLIGFQDNEHKFHEMKKVYVTEKGQILKITTLKHYVVTENYQLVGE